MPPTYYIKPKINLAVYSSRSMTRRLLDIIFLLIVYLYIFFNLRQYVAILYSTFHERFIL